LSKLENLPSQGRLAAILSSTEDGLLTFALDGTIQLWSRGAERLYGYTESEIQGQSVSRILAEESTPRYEGLLHAAIAGEFPQVESAERRHKDGSLVRVQVTRTPVRDANGQIVEILEYGSAIVQRAGEICAEGALQQAASQMPMIVWTTDKDLRITAVCGGGLPGMKTRPEDLIGKSVQEYLKCQDHTTPLAQHYEALQGQAVRFEYKRSNRVLELHLGPLRSPSGEIIGCVGAGLDISERKRTEEKVRYQATHDALTGLANYREFVDALERELRRSERNNRAFAVLLLDLDALKRINDRLGHLAGNRALKRLAAVMKEQCRSTDLAARYGGDEFAVLLIDSDPGMARHIAERMQTALKTSREEPPLTVSIGVSVYPDDGRTVQELLETADRQLYQRKRASHARDVSVR
jgi:diguanylate cyclase (GGDEF)-like protein/PAS domain S-box-containing protein